MIRGADGPLRRSILIAMKVRINRLVTQVIAIPFLLTAGGLALARDAEALRPKLTIDSSPADRSGADAGYAEVVERVSPSVVSIVTESRGGGGGQSQLPEELFNDPFFRRFFEGMRPDFRQPAPQPRRQGQGSGVLLTPDGFIATNNHVVDGADKIEVILANGRDKYNAEVVGRDPGTDVALIKIDAKGLPAATLGDSSKLRAGDRVLAIGNPFGLSQTVTSGIVSALKRTNLGITGERGYESFIQTDASINPGNSGGPLIDHLGRVVGINTAIFGRAGGNIGIGFAIPINMAVDIADRLQSTGEVERGYLGILLGQLTPELAEGFGIEANGVLVNEVQPDTPAQKAGFKAGDVILAYQGQEVTDMAELRLRVANTAPGTEAKFEVLREGKRQTLTAKIGKLPSEGGIASGPGRGDRPDGQGREFIPGVQITALTDELRQQLGVPENVNGVVIRQVDPDSDAAAAGLAQGMVIQRVGNHPAASVAEAMKALRDAKDRVILYVFDGEYSRFVTVKR